MADSVELKEVSLSLGSLDGVHRNISKSTSLFFSVSLIYWMADVGNRLCEATHPKHWNEQLAEIDLCSWHIKSDQSQPRPD